MATKLWSSQARLERYDMVVLGCAGAEFGHVGPENAALINFANGGGRVLAFHYRYTSHAYAAPSSGTAVWNLDQFTCFSSDAAYATINPSFTRGAALSDWLLLTGASTMPGQAQVGDLRHDVDAVLPAAKLWLTAPADMGPVPVLFSFETPVGMAPAQQCGRVTYADFHTNPSDYTGLTFPGGCLPDAATRRDKLLEFMVFDLGSCL